jgi:RHS repeat-associated protein
VVADAVMLARDNSADADNERKDYEYLYDSNGNLTTIQDTSPGAAIDNYDITYTGLNQLDTVREKTGSTVKHTTRYTYDPNGNPLTRTHDGKPDRYTYDPRDLLTKVENLQSASDPDPKVTSFTYTPRGQRLKETKANGNTVDSAYFLDGLLQHQLERKPGGTLVSEHTLDYDPNGNRKTDTSKQMNADNHQALIQRVQSATYDPRDRIATLTKTDPSTGTTVDSEAYVHDANDNVISQTLNATTTTFNYDRNRLQTAVTGGTTANYNYDPFGRLDSVTSGTQVLQRYSYDGFDRIAQHTKLNSSGSRTTTTRYTYDPLDRTSSQTDNAGQTSEKTTTFTYLGLSGDVVDERVAGQLQRSYQYSPWGQRLSQTKHNSDGTSEDSFYGYDPHTSVETLTDLNGDTHATYGYTAYGQDDDQSFTGVDKPDPQDPTKQPYNSYRYTAKRFDPASGTYDLGFRDYDPGLNRFLTRDAYNGALDDLDLASDPFTSNRYAFAAGNPTTMVDQTGHTPTRDNMVSANPALNVQWNDTRNAGSETLCEKRGACLGEGWTPQVARDSTREFEAALMQDSAPGSGANSGDGFTGGSLGVHQLKWCRDMGKIACLNAIRFQQKALKKTNELADKYGWSPGRRNAFRHSYWMGLMTLHGFSYDDAIALGEAHEKDTDTPGELPGSPDSNADLHNNAVGARIGVDIRPWYVAAFGVGATNKQEEKLQERLLAMDGGTARGTGEGSIVCTSDGCLTIVEPNR